MITLGINLYGHDTAAALVIDGELVCAIEEERLSRNKHEKGLPLGAIDFCLNHRGITLKDVDLVAFSTDLERLVREKYLRYHLENFAATKAHLAQSAGNITDILAREEQLRKSLDFDGQAQYFQHHECHLASAFFQSGFSEAAAVSIDGQGEFETTMVGHAHDGAINILSAVDFPNSIGFVYSALTYFLGFSPNSAEGTVMALAALGDPDAKIPSHGKSYYDFFHELVELRDDGQFVVNTSWFNFPFTRDGWVSDAFKSVLGEPRKPNDKLTSHQFNLAAALQRRFEDTSMHVLSFAQARTGSANLALAGGCALNCVSNGQITSRTSFSNVYIQPAAGDAGCAIGAAQLAARQLGDILPVRLRSETYLGPEFDNEVIKTALKARDITYESTEDPSAAAATWLAEGRVIGWFQGRMEFGPRALGNRSILAAPFPAEMKDRINLKVKHREPFRPFAPAILDELFNDVFNGLYPSPFMLLAMTVKAPWRDKVPAILHSDQSARVQTVRRDTNGRFYELIRGFYERTGVPVVLNTSFNDKGEPIVCSPDDALNTFLKTELDGLIMGNFLVSK